LVRIGWQNGILVHNLALLTGYLLLAIAWSFGLPARIALFGLLTSPVGFLQMWQLRRIESGKKPSWSALTLNALASFSLLVYAVTFGYWIG
jgi:1,4-dihydroxy-2-naphthoate octaprenyltransferase